MSVLSSLFGSGQEGGTFIDCDPATGTGQEISGAYIKCGDCHEIIREEDINCAGCGKTIDREKNAPLWEAGRASDAEARKKFGM